MSASRSVLASAVIVPDAEDLAPKGAVSAKRRRSSVSNEENKRARISPPPNPASKTTAPESRPRPTAQERKSQDVEERKRGKRLFGALLGALNQSSSSAAQRRRSDIERKQQEKLKLQTQEYKEQQEREREDLLKVRREKHEAYLKQAARTRRDNTAALAHFLQTTAEPKLYYKPWELLPDQKCLIDKQIKESHPSSQQVSRSEEALDRSEQDRNEINDHDTNAPEATAPVANEAGVPSGENGASDINVPPETAENRDRHSRRLSEEAAEDGGDDFVKGDEDDVLY